MLKRSLTATIVLAVTSLPTSSAQADSVGADALHDLTHMFANAALVGEPRLVDCKLSGGTVSKCFAITVKGEPVDHPTGPWCPGSIEDTNEAGGIWLENGKVYAVDGPFIERLAAFYKDPEWSLFDPATGKIRVTDTKAGCEAAARPNVDPAYNNYCVQCQLDYMGHTSERTYVLPLEPVVAVSPSDVTDLTSSGVALNGVRVDGPAPTHAILAAHTLAPFDDCGGHINLHVGYHYHAAMGCSKKVANGDGHAPAVGIAMDGYKLHARFNLNGETPADLDQCGGHETEELGYHYHVADPGKNAIISCHRGERGCSNAGSDTSCDATKTLPGRPRRLDE